MDYETLWWFRQMIGLCLALVCGGSLIAVGIYVERWRVGRISREVHDKLIRAHVELMAKEVRNLHNN